MRIHLHNITDLCYVLHARVSFDNEQWALKQIFFPNLILKWATAYEKAAQLIQANWNRPKHYLNQ